jgi:hypothetical protein
VDVDELLETARAETGLADFGDPGFAEGLRVLVGSLERDAQLNAVGALALPQQIVGNLTNRLRVTDWISRHPEVMGEVIERPLFVLGLPRTGTTLLSYLLDQDPGTRSLMRWEAQQSVPPPEAATFTSDPRIDAAREAAGMLDTLNPGFKAVHYEAPDGPTECVAVFAQDFKSVLWETVANIPAYGEWLRACDYTSAYEYHRRVLQLLQSRAPGRWSLKSPAHCLALDALSATYPDARFVVTHRDPVTTVASTVSLVISLSGTFSDADHREYIARHWLDVLSDIVTRLEAFRSEHDDGRFHDVGYADLVRDPVGTVRGIYEHFDDDLSPAAERAMAGYAADNRQGKHGTHQYRAEDLGVDRAEVDARFAAYRARTGALTEPA